MKNEWDLRDAYNYWSRASKSGVFIIMAPTCNFLIRLKKLPALLLLLLAFTSCKKEEIKPECYICQVKVGSDLIVAETRCTPQQPQVFIGDTTVICKLKK